MVKQDIKTKTLTQVVKEMIASYSSWPIMAHGDRTYAPRVAKWLEKELINMGWKPPEDK